MHPVIIDEIDRARPAPTPEQIALVARTCQEEAQNRRAWAESYPAHRVQYINDAAAFEAVAAMLRRTTCS